MTSQLLISNLEEDMVASRLRNIRRRLDDIVHELEERTLNRDILVELVRDAERGLRQTRQRL